jgi:peroxiredoxin
MLAIITFVNIANAQVKNEPKDTLIVKPEIFNSLKKAEPGDIESGTPMMLNPSTTPMYYENFVLIKEGDFIKIMLSGDYIPEPYIDSNKVVKAFLLRKATELEKEQMKQMQANMQNPGQNKSELIGKEAFPFSVTDISGKKYSLDKLKGKVIVINFWFVECKPCVMEIPELNDLVDKYNGKEVVFLGFATNDKSKIENFLKTKTFKYNIIADSKEVAGLYKVNSYPTHLVIDTNSIISNYMIGLGPTTVKDLDKTIESLLK